MSISESDSQLLRITLLDNLSDMNAAKFNQSPQELIEILYCSSQKRLVNDILHQIKSMSPAFFERLVVDLMVKMGYGGYRDNAGRVVGGCYDEGIDGVITEDRLGLDIIYIQAKRWQNTVGRPDIQKFVGALQGKRARKGIFITTSGFSSEAVLYVANIDTNIVLIDGEKLAEMMIDFNVGVMPVKSFELKRLDSEYFCE